jgi:transposase
MQERLGSILMSLDKTLAKKYQLSAHFAKQIEGESELEREVHAQLLALEQAEQSSKLYPLACRDLNRVLENSIKRKNTGFHRFWRDKTYYGNKRILLYWLDQHLFYRPGARIEVRQRATRLASATLEVEGFREALWYSPRKRIDWPSEYPNLATLVEYD